MRSRRCRTGADSPCQLGDRHSPTHFSLHSHKDRPEQLFGNALRSHQRRRELDDPHGEFSLSPTAHVSQVDIARPDDPWTSQDFKEAKGMTSADGKTAAPSITDDSALNTATTKTADFNEFNEKLQNKLEQAGEEVRTRWSRRARQTTSMTSTWRP